MKIKDAAFSMRREGGVLSVSIRMPYAGEPGCDLQGNAARAAFIRWLLASTSALLFDPQSQNAQRFAAYADTLSEACADDEDSEFGELSS